MVVIFISQYFDDGVFLFACHLKFLNSPLQIPHLALQRPASPLGFIERILKLCLLGGVSIGRGPDGILFLRQATLKLGERSGQLGYLFLELQFRCTGGFLHLGSLHLALGNLVLVVTPALLQTLNTFRLIRLLPQLCRWTMQCIKQRFPFLVEAGIVRPQHLLHPFHLVEHRRKVQ